MTLKTTSMDAVERHELTQLCYSGDDLGSVYSPAFTAFRVFAPTAVSVSLMLYETSDAAQGREVAMSADVDGTWRQVVPGDLSGVRYTYRVYHGDHVSEAVDPYARALTANGRRGVVVDLRTTDPEGWDHDVRPALDGPTDAVIYEVHVRDITISPTSGVKHPGKYLGLAERGTVGPKGVATGLDHLVELGVTHVHLMPIQDYASTDETDPHAYNWGYDPYHFFVPEGSYSTDPFDPEARIREVKTMIQAMHAAGLRVVMDVVYNHTYTVWGSPLHEIAPDYYHRTCGVGRYTNGSGCGNELATERPMVRKLILDSLKYWVREYHVDGFRFDLMALIDTDTVRRIATELREIEPSLLIYGEPWTGGVSGLAPSRMFTKGRQRSMGVAVFNDGYRDALKGDNDGSAQGFATGAPWREREVMRGVVGGTAYSHDIFDFSDQPEESINYVSCHDNLTLRDKISRSNPLDPKGVRIRMGMLAQSIVLTSQGIPFLEGGTEFLRTKKGCNNSYNAGDDTNQFDWTKKRKHASVFKYYRGLVEIRRAHPGFRMRSAQEIRERLRFMHMPPNSVGFVIDGRGVGDDWDTIVVIYNANRHRIEAPLPEAGPWKVAAAGGTAGNAPLRRGAYVLLDNQDSSSGMGRPSVVVAPISTTILFTESGRA